MRRFVIAFAAGLVLFAGLNLLWAHLRSDCGLPALLGTSGCADDIRRAGFPFLFYESGGFDYRNLFSAGALAADIGLGLLLALAMGWAAERFGRGPGK